MKKTKFKYKVGQSVKFRFYDGSVHAGKIEIAQYRNSEVDYLPTEYSQPMYTCHVPDDSGAYSRGYMVYTVTENMIKDKNNTAIKIIPLEKHVETSSTNVVLSSELDEAIAKQNQFIGGKVIK